MALLLLVILAVVLAGTEVSRHGFFSDSLSPAPAAALKGVFILLIVLSHAMGYFDTCGYGYTLPGDQLARKALLCLGQLVVVVFLFLSGYGVMRQTLSRGATYVATMPRRRLLATLLNFDVAVTVFAAVALLLGLHVGWRQFGLALLAWDSVGNSNWYIFAILLCYAVAWLSLLVFGASRPWRAVAGTVAALLAAIAVLQAVKPPMWSDTLLSFPAGMAWAAGEQRGTTLLRRHWWPATAALMVLFAALYFAPGNWGGLRPNFTAVAFALLTVAVVQRIRPGGAALRWCGNHLFPLYIYQRLPMLVLATLWPAFVTTHAIAFVTASFAVTVAVAASYPRWQLRL